MPPLKRSGQRVNPRIRIGLCVLAMMAALGILGFVWWGTSWATVALLALGLMCLASAFYIWLTARRLDKLLEHIGEDEAAKKRTGSGKG